MWLRRLAALAAAVALVAGAFAIRDRRASKGGSATATTVGGASGDSTPAKGFTLVCATELRALCEGTLSADVTVRIESVATTAAKFTGAADPRTVGTAWLTIDPWPGLSDGRRPTGTAFGALTRLGYSPVGVAVRKPRNEKLAAACGGKVTLACAGDKGATPWTDLGGNAEWQVLKPTITDPLTSASGPASLAAAVREQRNGQGLALIDLQSDLTFNKWLRNFLRPSGSATALEQAVLQPVYDAVVVPEAEFTATATPSGRFAFEGPSTFSAELVLAPIAGVTVAKSIVEALTAQAAKAGWRAGAAPIAALDANLVAGMQTVWKESS